jgi:hypothetical protein
MCLILVAAQEGWGTFSSGFKTSESKGRTAARNMPSYCCWTKSNPIYYDASMKVPTFPTVTSWTCNSKQQNLFTEITWNSVAAANCSNTMTSHGSLTQVDRISPLNEAPASVTRESVTSQEFLNRWPVRVSCFPQACYMSILKVLSAIQKIV